MEGIGVRVKLKDGCEFSGAHIAWASEAIRVDQKTHPLLWMTWLWCGQKINRITVW